MTTVAAVNLWGRQIGAIAQPDDRDYAAFEYDPAFVTSGIQVSPITMPLAKSIYSFPELARQQPETGSDRDPARGHLGGRGARQGGDRLEPKNE